MESSTADASKPSHFKSAVYRRAYNILCAAITNDKERSALYPSLCQIPPFGETSPHSHFEEEVFIVVRGRGKLRIDENTRQDQILSEGSLVKIPAGKTHQLFNLSEAPLEFVSVYTEDYTLVAPPVQVLVSAAPPTPNGPLHLGHISGPYLAADSIRRYYKLRGSQVESSSGTDDHQNYVERRAMIQKQRLEEFTSSMRQRIQKGLAVFQIEFSEFLEPRKDIPHQNLVRSFVQSLEDKKIAQRTVLDFPFCEHCELFLSDAYLKGQCPECSNASSGGCEACGQVYPATRIVNPFCGGCGEPASMRKTSVLEFPIGKYFPLIQKDLEGLDLPQRVRNMLNKIKLKKDHRIQLTQPTNSSFGIELNAGESIHVWTEMAAAYQKFAHSSATWISCFGFDNAFYYLVFIPSLLRALDIKAKLPDQVVVNEFLLLDQLKFSTSRNHAIWADELDPALVDAEILRFYLLLHRPNFEETNFELKEFMEFQKSFFKTKEQIFKLALETKDPSQMVTSTKSPLIMRQTAQLNRLTKDFESCFEVSRIDLRKAAKLTLGLVEDLLAEKSQGSLNFSRLLLLKQFFAVLMPAFSLRLSEQLKRPAGEWIQDLSGHL